MTNNTQITINPEVSIINATPMVSSLNIAEVFNKEHRNVVRSICNLQNDLDTVAGGNDTALNFELSEYRDASGKANISYNLNRDAFSLLVMGFTGKRALEWKLKYIAAFNAMERELTSPAQFAPVAPQPALKAPRARVVTKYVEASPYTPLEQATFDELIKLDACSLTKEIMFERKRYLETMEFVKKQQAEIPALLEHMQGLANGENIFESVKKTNFKVFLEINQITRDIENIIANNDFHDLAMVCKTRINNSIVKIIRLLNMPAVANTFERNFYEQAVGYGLISDCEAA
jgi:Rha family phage regulatory protein